MPRLDWIGKKSVVNHHREVPFEVVYHKRAKVLYTLNQNNPNT